MATKQRAGFTIIEVMLFLAVGAALTIAIMAGMSAGIAAQRYQDAVATLQSDVQQQYEDVVSVANYREGASAISGCTGTRGASDCVILGKLLTISPGGILHKHEVYGREPSSSALNATSNEYDALRLYDPAWIGHSMQSARMEWGTRVYNPGGASTDISILILRSPQSGSVYTFTVTGTLMHLRDMIDRANTERRILCVDPDGWVTAESRAVVIVRNASSASGVEVRTNQMLEGASQC